MMKIVIASGMAAKMPARNALRKWCLRRLMRGIVRDGAGGCLFFGPHWCDHSHNGQYACKRRGRLFDMRGNPARGRWLVIGLFLLGGAVLGGFFLARHVLAK